MLTKIMCALLLASSTMVYAQGSIPKEFQGGWDISKKMCDDVNKQVIDSETRIEINSAQIMTYRDTCKVLALSKSDATLLSGTFSCTSNEDDSSTKEKLMLAIASDSHLIWNKTNYVSCAAPSKADISKVTTVTPICTYTTKISANDKKNSSGVEFPLTKTKSTVAAIIRQDRANYYQFNVRDAEDQADCLFSDKGKRALIEKGINESVLSPELIQSIVEQNPVLAITVFDNGQINISNK